MLQSVALKNSEPGDVGGGVRLPEVEGGLHPFKKNVGKQSSGSVSDSAFPSGRVSDSGLARLLGLSL